MLALPDDTTTEFATLVIRDLAPETQILARIEEQANISKTYRAGGDYVLSLARVTGRMSAAQLLGDRDVVSLNQQVNIRGRTGCMVVAIEREESVITDIAPETTLQPGDEIVVVGTDEAINEFVQEF